MTKYDMRKKIEDFLKEKDILKVHQMMNEYIGQDVKNFENFWQKLDFFTKVKFIVKIGQYGGEQDFLKFYELMKKQDKSVQKMKISKSKKQKMKEEQTLLTKIVKWILERAQFLKKINQFIKQGEEQQL